MKSRILSVVVAMPVLASASIISSGTVTIPGTFSFDFDAGVVDNFALDSEADVFWEQFTPSTRAVEPTNGATIVNLGVVSFAAITLSDLEALSYGSSGLDGSDVGSVLVPNDVFAVHTTDGNFAKVLVTGPLVPGSDNGLPIQWETDSSAVPEPGYFFLLAGLLLALVFRHITAARWRRA